MSSPAARDRRAAAGFSVLEMLFVATLVGVIASISLPMASSAVAVYRLEVSSRVLAGKIVEARSEALKRNRTAWVLLDVTARTAQVRTLDDAGAVVGVGGIVPLSPTVAFAGIPGATAQVRFDSVGRLLDLPPRTVRVRSLRLGTERVLTILVTGRVTVA